MNFRIVDDDNGGLDERICVVVEQDLEERKQSFSRGKIVEDIEMRSEPQ